jgi:hypothetical protein
MALPQRTEYSEAIQNLRQCVSDDELRAGEPAANALGLPLRRRLQGLLSPDRQHLGGQVFYKRVAGAA